MVIGDDFRFGHNCRGTPDFPLAPPARCISFSVDILDLLPEGEEAVSSSSRIRAALGGRDVPTANGLLGYHWFFGGEVVKGDQRGRELGFPTANIATSTSFGLAQGVYAVRARLGTRLLDGVASYGKPMFDNQLPPFETYLFDFDEDIYGARLDVALIGHVRGQEIFKGLDDLIAAIARRQRQSQRRAHTLRPDRRTGQEAGFLPLTKWCSQHSSPAPAGEGDHAKHGGGGGRLHSARFPSPARGGHRSLGAKQLSEGGGGDPSAGAPVDAPPPSSARA